MEKQQKEPVFTVNKFSVIASFLEIQDLMNLLILNKQLHFCVTQYFYQFWRILDHRRFNLKSMRDIKLTLKNFGNLKIVRLNLYSDEFDLEVIKMLPKRLDKLSLINLRPRF